MLIPAALIASLASPIVQASIPAPPNLPDCAFDAPARRVDKLRDLPGPIRAEVSRFFGAASGGLAEAGTMFIPTDYIDDPTAPRRRFIRAYFVRDVWFIWYEQGGFASSYMMVALTRQSADEGPARHLATPGSRFVGNLCAGSKAYLTGARSFN